PATHDPGAQDAGLCHDARLGRARIFLRALAQEEERDQITRDRMHEKIAGGLRFEREAFGLRAADGALEHVEDAKRRRIVAARLVQDALSRLRDHEGAPQRIAIDEPPLPRDPRGLGRRAQALGERALGAQAEVLVRQDVVDQAHATRAPAVERLSAEQEIERGNEADQARQARRAAKRGQDAEAHFGKGEGGVARVGGEAITASQRQLEPAAHARAFDRHCRRLGKLGDLPVDRLAERRLGLGVAGLAHGADRGHVGAGDELSRLAAREQEPGHAWSLAQRLELHAQFLERRFGEQVDASARLVEDQHPDAGGAVLEAERARRLVGLALAHAASTIIAAPCPPPTHSVASPIPAWRRRISSSSVSTMRAPLTPTGWPSAMAPPFTFMRERSMPPMGSERPNSSAANFAEAKTIALAITCAAKASLISISSMSESRRPARSRASGVA